MLRNLKDFDDCVIGATDGTIGHVRDFFFDDQTWVVRYLVVDTGTWLSSRKVLLSPIAIARPDGNERVLQVRLTRQQVKDSPDIDTEKPVSRQHEVQYAQYYGYPYYWGGTGYWADGLYPILMLPSEGAAAVPHATPAEQQAARARTESAHGRSDDPHLRSAREIAKYRVHATDGDIGHIQGLLLDDQTWAIRYLIVDTSNWWLGHEVLVAPSWIEAVSWPDSKVSVKMTRQAIKDAPPYEPGSPPDRGREAMLHAHHGVAGYWTDHDVRDTEISHF